MLSRGLKGGRILTTGPLYWYKPCFRGFLSSVGRPSRSSSAVSESRDVFSSIDLPSQSSSAVSESRDVFSSVDLPSQSSSAVSELRDVFSSVDLPSQSSSAVSESRDVFSSVDRPGHSSSAVSESRDVFSSVDRPSQSSSAVSESRDVFSSVDRPGHSSSAVSESRDGFSSVDRRIPSPSAESRDVFSSVDRPSPTSSAESRDVSSTVDPPGHSSCTESGSLYDPAGRYLCPINASTLQLAVLAVGSSVIGLLRPQRGDMVAVSGETTATPALPRLLRIMQRDEEGSRLLRDRPVLDSDTVDFDYLRSLPEGTLGREYCRFMEKRGFSPDDRLPVRFISDPELAYVMLRYRQSHDLVHTLLQQNTNLLGEVVVKCVEALQTGLPMCIGAAVFSPLRLPPKARRRFFNTLLPWAYQVGVQARPLINVYWEHHWQLQLSEMRTLLNIPAPPE